MNPGRVLKLVRDHLYEQGQPCGRRAAKVRPLRVRPTLSLALVSAVLLLLQGAGLLAQAPSVSEVVALGRLVPAHHALHAFDGPVSWHAYRPPPDLRFEQPDFEAWAANLEEVPVDPDASRFVGVWRDVSGAIRYVLAKSDQPRLFALDDDTIEFEDPGFLTQVGVARWGWAYREGLLRTHRTWRMALAPADGSGRPSGPPAPTSLYAVTTYEYRRGQSVPHQSRTFWSEEDRLAGRWGQKSTYDRDGRLQKTRHNPERPYPY